MSGDPKANVPSNTPSHSAFLWFALLCFAGLCWSFRQAVGTMVSTGKAPDAVYYASQRSHVSLEGPLENIFYEV